MLRNRLRHLLNNNSENTILTDCQNEHLSEVKYYFMRCKWREELKEPVSIKLGTMIDLLIKFSEILTTEL